MSQPEATLPDAAILYWIRYTTVCARACVCETESETEIVGCVAATFVAPSFIFYGLKQIVLHQ